MLCAASGPMHRATTSVPGVRSLMRIASSIAHSSLALRTGSDASRFTVLSSGLIFLSAAVSGTRLTGQMILTGGPVVEGRLRGGSRSWQVHGPRGPDVSH